MDSPKWIGYRIVFTAVNILRCTQLFLFLFFLPTEKKFDGVGKASNVHHIDENTNVIVYLIYICSLIFFCYAPACYLRYIHIYEKSLFSPKGNQNFVDKRWWNIKLLKNETKLLNFSDEFIVMIHEHV